MAAVDRLPLGTASALEFLGPLGVAVARGRGTTQLVGRGGAVGVVLLTEPWHGQLTWSAWPSPSAPRCCWAAYILLTQRVGDEVTGLNGLAVSMPVAGLVATAVAGPSRVHERADPRSCSRGSGWRSCCRWSRSPSSCSRCAG